MSEWVDSDIILIIFVVLSLATFVVLRSLKKYTHTLHVEGR